MKFSLTKKVALIVISIILFLIFCFFIKFIHHAIILNHVSNLAKEQIENTNYYYHNKNYLDNGTLITFERYNKANHYSIVQKIQSPTSTNLLEYKVTSNGTQMLEQFENGTVKKSDIPVDKTDSLIGPDIKTIYSIADYTNWTKFSTIVQSKISSVLGPNGKDCYLIQYNGMMLWIEQDTGLIIRKLIGNYLSDYQFSFNTVTDEQVAMLSI